MQQPVSTSEAVAVPSHVRHPSFELPEAETLYGWQEDSKADEVVSHMPDELTRLCAQKMHYSAFRTALEGLDRANWYRQYLSWRNRIVVGNHKLVYRAVRQWRPPTAFAEDMIGDCHIVLIQAVSAYNPWVGVRFSTYSFICLMRAISRLSHRYASNLLYRSLRIDILTEGEPQATAIQDLPAPNVRHIDDYLQTNHKLLSSREKFVIIHRFRLEGQKQTATLQQIGSAMGLSREGVRQVEARALKKLREALQQGTSPPSSGWKDASVSTLEPARGFR